jgi:hypothetical protein
MHFEGILAQSSHNLDPLARKTSQKNNIFIYLQMYYVSDFNMLFYFFPQKTILVIIPKKFYMSLILSYFGLMKGNQLPVSVNRWQHGSQVYFATFI